MIFWKVYNKKVWWPRKRESKFPCHDRLIMAFPKGPQWPREPLWPFQKSQICPGVIVAFPKRPFDSRGFFGLFQNWRATFVKAKMALWRFFGPVEIIEPFWPHLRRAEGKFHPRRNSRRNFLWRREYQQEGVRWYFSERTFSRILIQDSNSAYFQKKNMWQLENLPQNVTVEPGKQRIINLMKKLTLKMSESRWV